MKLKFTFILLLSLSLYFFSALSLNAQNRHISIQGTLKDASGAAVSDGDQELTFKLYHSSGGDEVLWQEKATVPVVGGIYSHNLGSEAEFPEDIFGQTLYLGVTVGGRELSPRTELTYAPYAISVASTQKIAQGGCSGQVGDIKFSILKPEDFAKENGDCWIPMNGGDISGSSLATILNGDRSAYSGIPINKVPDMSGHFIRAVGSGANAVGTEQGQDIQAHTHEKGDLTTKSSSHSHTYKATDDENGAGENFFARFVMTDESNGRNKEITVAHTDDTHSHDISGSTKSTGGPETRPKNMSFYIYIRIN